MNHIWPSATRGGVDLGESPDQWRGQRVILEDEDVNWRYLAMNEWGISDGKKERGFQVEVVDLEIFREDV